MLVLSQDMRQNFQTVPDLDHHAEAHRAELAAQMRKVIDLIRNCAGLSGVELSTSDLSEALIKTQPDQKLDLAAIATVLQEQAVVAKIHRQRRLPKAGYPALLETKAQGLLLVTQHLGDRLCLWDPFAPGHERELPLAEAKALYAGQILRISSSLEQLQQRHLAAPPKRHWFWGEWRHFRRPLGEVTLASLIANILAVAVSLFSMQVYDRVIPYQSQPTLWVLGMGAILAIGLEAGLKIARASLMDHTGRKIEVRVQDRLMGRVLGLKVNPANQRPSEVFSAMRDFASVREFFTAATIGTLADLPFVVLFLALIASIGGDVVWLVVLGGLLMVLPGLFFRGRFLRMAKDGQGSSVAQARVLYEAVFEHETLVSERGTARYGRIWSELVALSAIKGGEQRHLTTLMTSWSMAMQQLTYIGVVITGTYLVFAGAFSMGTIIAVGILTGRCLQPLAQLSTLLARWSQVKTALEALGKVADAPQREDAGRSYLRRDVLRGHFELEQLQFSYDPKGTAACVLDRLAILPGQKMAVLGANGSGKSTMLRLLAGLYHPSHGRLLLDGLDISQIHPRDIRRNIGYLGQDVRLVAGTIRENLNLAQLARDDGDLLQALDFAGLGPFIRAHPMGLDFKLHEGGAGLSVGQRQSIGWARIWLQNPTIVILDEPTAALDQTLEAQLIGRLGQWLEGRTVMIATHRVPILQLVDRMLILQNGRLAVDGPREAVLAHLTRGQGAPLHVTPVAN